MQITLADYLVKRLKMLGIRDVFGLPGDYNFNILDAIEDSEGINWVNCTNELNAAYVADGYARVNGFGAVVTTFGVGELSSVNAIAGSFAENVPVMKIAGVPKTKMIENNVVLHHNFANPDYYAFERVYSNVTETTAFLNKDNAKSEIDRIIEVFVKTRRPVYVAIPADVCKIMVDDTVPELLFTSDEDVLSKVVENISSIINEAKRPVILADYIVERHGLHDEFNNFVSRLNIPVSTLLMGKSLIAETEDFFIGTSLGNLSPQSVQDTINNSDCVVCFGTLFCDLNTGGFSIMPNENYRIEIQADYCVIDGQKFADVYMKDVISGLEKVVNRRETFIEKAQPWAFNESSDEQLKIDEIFPRLQNFLKSSDLLFIETGVISFASGSIKLPKGANYYSQTLWGSIGWATPAVFGGAMADKSRRAILFTGEGAHQLTVQEVANMLHHDVKPVLFVLNNSGYTIERILSKDPKDPFNEITKWNYSKLPEVFSGDFCSIQVRSSKELDEALKKVDEESKTKLCYVELFTEEMDVPESSNLVVENLRNSHITKVLTKK